MREIWKEFQPLTITHAHPLANIVCRYLQSALAVATLYGVCRIAGMGLKHGLGL